MAIKHLLTGIILQVVMIEFLKRYTSENLKMLFGKPSFLFGKAYLGAMLVLGRV